MRDSGLAAAWRALLSPEVGSTATSFEEYRSDVLRSRLAAIAWATLFGGVLFRLVLIITRPEQWFVEWQVMLVTLALPAGLILARHTRLARAPDVLILGAYLIYIGAGLTRAFMPTAFTSGIEVSTVVGLMVMAILFPWSVHFQAIAASLTLMAYWGALWASGRIVPGNLELAHQLTSPAFAAIMSVLGVAIADRLRRQSFEQRRAAEHEAQVRGHFAAILSHELRNLLTAVQGYGEMLVQEVRDMHPSLADVPSRIEALAREGLDIIHVTLELSRTEQGALAAQRRPVEVATLVASLEREFAPLLSMDGAQLSWSCDRALVFDTDPNKVEMILRNLIGNALKFTREGEVRVTIQRTSRPKGVEIVVADTGPGIAAEELERVFEPFQQGRDGRGRAGSAGLGLYVVARLSAALGGSVSAESEVGRGTIFRVVLPSMPGV